MVSHDAVLSRTEPAPARIVGSLLLGVAGGALLGARNSWDGRARQAFTVAGLALLGAAAHVPVTESLRRVGSRRRSAEVRLSFVVHRPVEEVFAFCRDFENFPRFISGLRSVHDHGDGRSHWIAATPAGHTIEWDTVTTKYVPNRVIAWRSTGTTRLRSTGLIRFRPESGSTCVEVVVTYEVAPGALTDSLAALLTPSRAGRLAADIRGLENSLTV